MKTIFGFILFSIFLCLSLLHFYWAIGGKWGFYEALPEKENGEKLFLPGVFSCVVVGMGLLSFGILTLSYLGFLQIIPIPHFVAKSAIRAIAIVFFARAIGDFRYVGFFKSINKTTFAKNDTKFYSPLCLFLCVMCVILLVI